MKVLLITSGYNSVTQKLLSNKDIHLIGIAFPRIKQVKSFKSKLTLSLSRGFFQLKALFSTYRYVPAFEFEKNSQKELAKWISKLKPDLIVSFSSPFLFKKEILSLAPQGIMNVHLSVLPKYRGPQPLLWQYINFDLTHGATVHFLDETEDTGDIIAQDGFLIEKGQPYEKTLQQCEVVAYKLLIKAIESLENGTIKRSKQPSFSLTSRAARITNEEIIDLIRWSEWPMDHINHVVNGLGITQPKNFPDKGQNSSKEVVTLS